jgi:hypothetical protein
MNANTARWVARQPPGLVDAIRAVWGGHPTEEQRAMVNAWIDDVIWDRLSPAVDRPITEVADDVRDFLTRRPDAAAG